MYLKNYEEENLKFAPTYKYE